MFSTFPQLPSCRHRRLAGLAVLVCVGLAASACQSTMSSNRLDAPGFDAASGAEGSIKDTAQAGQAWRADPANIELGLSYAANLQALGQTADQIKVLDELARRNPDDANLQAYYGKQLTTTAAPPTASGFCSAWWTPARPTGGCTPRWARRSTSRASSPRRANSTTSR
jgi:hypothetical protein